MRQIVFRSRAVPAEGRVVGLAPTEQYMLVADAPVETPAEVAMVEYTCRDGRTVRALTQGVVDPDKLPVGSTVTVWYRSDKPKHVCVDGVDPSMRRLKIGVVVSIGLLVATPFVAARLGLPLVVPAG